MQINKAILGSLAIGSMVTLSGCTAMSTMIHHGSLTAESKMSNSIILPPTSNKDKTIYVQVKSTTDYDFKGLKKQLVANLQSEGWTVVDDVDQAHDMVQINVLQAGEAQSPQAAWGALGGGFGSSIATGGLAGLAAGYATGSTGMGIGVGAGVTGISWVADQMVKDVAYSMITDVQVSIRSKGKVTQTTQSDIAQGTSTATQQTIQQESDFMQYRTRIVSVADQVNLKFEEAKPVLEKQIAKQVAGIFID